jgi:NADH-quinone oxidoreductase subunit H
VTLPLADTTFVESTGVMVVKCIVIFAFVLAIVPMILLLERKLLGRFQNRYGPNRVGPYGLFQPLADVLKLLGKEQFYPRTGVPFLMALAPAIMIVTAIASLAIIPFGDVKHGLGAKYGLYGIDVNIGILYAFAFSSLAFYGLMLGGWASGSKYSFLGAMRSAAQLVSYEVSLGLSLIGVVMMAGSLSLVDIVYAQHAIWYVIPQFVGFLIFAAAGFAETNRPPFDLPEADAELVGGYNTEYGGMRFGSFFMAEYINMFVIAGLGSAMFLGGWRGPGPGYLDPVWMILKILAIVVFFIWIRATLPRLRYDQLMSFGWKVLLPLATLNLLVTAILVALL